jgi:hypothetical protein
MLRAAVNPLTMHLGSAPVQRSWLNGVRTQRLALDRLRFRFTAAALRRALHGGRRGLRIVMGRSGSTAATPGTLRSSGMWSISMKPVKMPTLVTVESA